MYSVLQLILIVKKHDVGFIIKKKEIKSGLHVIDVVIISIIEYNLVGVTNVNHVEAGLLCVVEQ